MGDDVLSDVLKAVRLTGAIFYDVSGHAPWAAEQPTQAEILPLILPGAEQLIAYHVVVEGRCFANLVGDTPIPVEAGEVIVITGGEPHVVSSAPGLRAPPSAGSAAAAAASGHLPCLVTYGTDGPFVRLICGFLACDARPFNPLLENLPPVIKAGRPGGRDPSWLALFARQVMEEASNRRSGSDSIIARLSELMFIEVIRQYLEEMPEGQTGWLAGLKDRSVGQVLSLMHSAPTKDWSIEELARESGVSRPVLSERFTRLVGCPPMRYLAKWRMQLAWRSLRSGPDSLATIAAECGYGSEAAFSRAFKRIVGVSPSVWRGEQVAHGSSYSIPTPTALRSPTTAHSRARAADGHDHRRPDLP